MDTDFLFPHEETHLGNVSVGSLLQASALQVFAIRDLEGSL